ncbi:hydroxyethylthiazole kinase [Rhizobium sp. RU20A]|uniref:hydroxyethylthiazole kinase n=1 Tax=Rhizobium sp. RU20A TaxID=1907412 RepID=UPI00122C9B28|nr:hydroxyethylthiazole kinase [Rhizobium sp. RU20A]
MVAATLLERVRTRRPRVHCLMNTVVQKFVADGVTAVGGIPSMTASEEEVGAFVRRADSLAVNLGTLDAARRRAIGLAVEVAGTESKPWIVDPVHCDYSPSRLAFAQTLAALGPAAVRGNAAEMMALGLQAGAPCAPGLVITTGPVDRLVTARRSLRIENGDRLMAGVTGTGCLAGAVIAAFLAVEPDAQLAAAAALSTTGVAAELAAPGVRGPASFGIAFLDVLATLSPDELLTHARIFDDRT